MKPRVLFFYFFGLALIGALFLSPVGVAGAVALYQAVTATNTFIPPSVTPSPSNFTCPSGTPAGWGTYTPSPLWELQCSNCSIVTTPTGTGLPVPTLNGTQFPTQYAATGTAQYLTGTPTSTATPIVTGTPLPFANITCGSVSAGLTCIQVDANTVSYQGYYFITYPAHGFPNLYFNLSVPSMIYFRLEGIDQIAYRHIGSNAPFGIYFRLNNGYDFSVGSVNTTWSTSNSSQQTNSTSPVLGNFYDTLTGSNQLQGQGAGTWANTYNSVDILSGAVIYVSSSPSLISGTPTPVVSPTPFIDTGYCSSVAPVIDGFGWELFVDDGDPWCGMGWNSIDIDWNKDTIVDYSIPGVQICLQPSIFGVITLFGNSYEVGIYGLAAAAAFFWRFLRTV